ncbi:hypothetical protein AC1031_021651 [Aphanomyces cochlioides]|nr:hypothetical protein AC1031_021651 [Aphanomyces cochlioides]
MLESLLTVSAIDIAGRAALLFLSFQAAWKLSSWADPRNEFHRTKENSFDPHSAAGYRQYRFNADRKLWLRTRWWLPPANTEWKGVVFIVHGYNEHIERYHYCGTKLAENGYAVFGIDHQGHGLSEGERLYVERFEHYEQDYIEFVRDTLALTSDSAHVKESMMHFPDGLKLASLPRFLLGHSMGSLISLQLIHVQYTHTPQCILLHLVEPLRSSMEWSNHVFRSIPSRSKSYFADRDGPFIHIECCLAEIPPSESKLVGCQGSKRA